MWSSSAACAILLSVALVVCTAHTSAPAAATQPADDAKLDDAARAKLSRPLPSFQFNGVEFESCLGYLAETGGVKIIVPWDQVKAAGINKYKPISFHFYKGTLQNALNTTLGAAAGKSGVLSFTIKRGDIVVVVKGASPTTQQK